MKISAVGECAEWNYALQGKAHSEIKPLQEKAHNEDKRGRRRRGMDINAFSYSEMDSIMPYRGY